MTKTLPAIAALALIALLAIAGCGSSSDSIELERRRRLRRRRRIDDHDRLERTSGGGTAAIVSAATVPKLGKVIVDSKGFTLYDFHKDKGGKSACYGACARSGRRC